MQNAAMQDAELRDLSNVKDDMSSEQAKDFFILKKMKKMIYAFAQIIP
jgi:hypothetical protein